MVTSRRTSAPRGEAHRLQPDLAPPAMVAARLLTRAEDIRRAVKTLETTWKAAPHPDIADAYATVRPGDSVRDRLKRMRRLAELRPGHPESALAVARAAIDAREFSAARTALEPLVHAQQSERVCLLMAEIEERENGDQGRVRTWLTRALTAPRDPAWVADGRVFERWAPVSPSGRVAAFEWKVVAASPVPPPPGGRARARAGAARTGDPAAARATATGRGRAVVGSSGRVGGGDISSQHRAGRSGRRAISRRGRAGTAAAPAGRRRAGDAQRPRPAASQGRGRTGRRPSPGRGRPKRP